MSARLLGVQAAQVSYRVPVLGKAGAPVVQWVGASGRGGCTEVRQTLEAVKPMNLPDGTPYGAARLPPSGVRTEVRETLEAARPMNLPLRGPHAGLRGLPIEI
jgi:hypothetical protein